MSNNTLDRSSFWLFPQTPEPSEDLQTESLKPLDKAEVDVKWGRRIGAKLDKLQSSIQVIHTEMRQVKQSINDKNSGNENQSTSPVAEIVQQSLKSNLQAFREDLKLMVDQEDSKAAHQTNARSTQTNSVRTSTTISTQTEFYPEQTNVDQKPKKRRRLLQVDDREVKCLLSKNRIIVSTSSDDE